MKSRSKDSGATEDLTRSTGLQWWQYALIPLLLLLIAGTEPWLGSGTYFRARQEGLSSDRSVPRESSRSREGSPGEPDRDALRSLDISDSADGPDAEPASPEGEEDTEARDEWFMFQREYPFESIPAEGRLRAWSTAQRNRRGAAIELAATNRWRAIGPAPTTPNWGNWGVTSGRINSIAVSPSDSRIVLIGAATGGIWRSVDGANTFTAVTDDQVDLAVGSMAFSPSSPAVVYAGMGDATQGYLGSGILKSGNAGETWTRVNNESLPVRGTVAALAVDPSNSNRVYVAQYSRLNTDRSSSSGLYLSTDGGVNWAKRLTGLARDVVIDPADRRTLYAALVRVDQEGGTAPTSAPAVLFKSTDSGSTWADIFSTEPFDQTQRRDMKIALSRSSPRTIYLYTGGFVNGSTRNHLMASTDGGQAWTERSLLGVDPAQFGYNTYIVTDSGSGVYLGARDLYRSSDGGESWTNATRNFVTADNSFWEYAPTRANSHPDQHAMVISPNSADTVYIGNDGGIWKSLDGGRQFFSQNSTLSLTQCVGISLHPTNPEISYVGSQDNGTQYRLGSTSRWREFSSGDGGHSVINPLDPSMVFTNYIQGNIFRFLENGRDYDTQVAWTASFGEPDDGPRIGFYPPFTGNGVDSTLYLATWRLFISTNLGDLWSAPAGQLDLTKGGRDVVNAIGVGPVDLNVIYTGSVQGRAMVSMDAGHTWTDVSAGLPNRSITSITLSRDTPGAAYLTVSGFATSHVFKTADFGSHWSDLSSGLPNIPVHSFLIDPINPNTLYAGTDIGVFRSTSGGEAWEGFTSGMPPVIVTGFAAQSNGLIQVATYGRGAYEIQSEGAGPPPPVISSATFDGTKKLTIDGAGFSEASKVLINGVDKSQLISVFAEARLKLKGKASKLGLNSGDNTLVVVNGSLQSNTFNLFR